MNLGLGAIFGAGIVAAIFYLLRGTVIAVITEGVKHSYAQALEDRKSLLAKEIESIKTALKFSEVRFSKQFEALVALRRLRRRVLPKKWHPEMDWSEALEDIANKFEEHIEQLENFLLEHEAVLPTPILRRLENALNAATDGQFEFDYDSKDDTSRPRAEALKLANKFYDGIMAAIKELQKRVDDHMPERNA